MKKSMIRVFVVSALTLAILFSACSKFLDEQSPNDLDAATAIKDAGSAEAALAGIYSAMQSDAYYGGQFPLMTEPLCHNATTGGYQFLSLDQLGSNSVTGANLLVEELWTAIYRVIANCNYLQEALPKVADMDAGRKLEVEAEVRALRALAHFDLLRTYAEHWNQDSPYGIPLITKVQKITDRPVRSSVRESYNAIVSDLLFAIDKVKEADANVQFLTRSGVSALLARVYWFQGEKDKALALSTQLIDNPNFALLPAADYAQVYTGRRSSESIFELAFNAQNRSGFNGLTYGRDDALRSEVFYLAAAELGAFFASRSGDARASLLDFDPDNNNASIIPDGRTQKYRGENDKDSPAYVLRLAEMYLLRAELKGYPDGLEDLNALRRQRGMADLQITTPPSGQEEWELYVLDEIRAEFNFEGQFYAHLARTGKFTSATGAEAFRAALPVPNREIAASDGSITQNPGY